MVLKLNVTSDVLFKFTDYIFIIRFMLHVHMLVMDSNCNKIPHSIVTGINRCDNGTIFSGQQMDRFLEEISDIDGVILICADAPRIEFFPHLLLSCLPSGFTTDHLYRYDTLV